MQSDHDQEAAAADALIFSLYDRARTVHPDNNSAVNYLLQNNTEAELFEIPWGDKARCSSSSGGFVLAGFRLDPAYAQPVTLTISFGFDPLTMILQPGDGRTVFALEGQCMLPTGCMRFVEVVMTIADATARAYCSVVWATCAYCDKVFRSWSGTLRGGRSWYVYRGCISDSPFVVDEEYDAPTRPFPRADFVPWAEKVARKRTWRAAVDAELFAAALHPTRMANWIEDCDDAAATKPSVLRLLGGEVLMVDGALKDEELERLATLADPMLQAPPGLHPCPMVQEVLQRALRRACIGSLDVCGELAMLGRSRKRKIHIDAPLQGGDVSLLLFLDNVDGGRVCFEAPPSPALLLQGDAEPPPSPMPLHKQGARGRLETCVASRAGRLLVFGVYVPHRVEETAADTPKRIVGCEARFRHVNRPELK